jgi:hypothetical protein
MAPGKPPVNQGQRITEILDALVVSGVAGHEFQAMHQGDRGDHRLGQANAVAGAFEVAPDAARHLGGGLGEVDDFLTGGIGEQGGDFLGTLYLLEAFDHLHDGDDRSGQSAMHLAVGVGVDGDGEVNRAEDFGVDVSVKQRLIHPA